MIEGKWFADTYEGVLLHAAGLYPTGDFHVVAADIPDDVLDRLFRSDNLDRFGPATFFQPNELVLIAPILEPANYER
jgi:hypothetical protein